MRRYQALGLVVTALAGLVLAGAAPANASTDSSVRYRIADVDTRTFATASRSVPNVTMQPASTTIGAQVWVFTDTTSGTTIVNGLTDGCLSVAATSTRPVIVQEPCDRSPAQFWAVRSATTSTVIFHNRGRDGCMAADPTSSTDPVRLYLVPCNTDDRNQHFRLVA